MHKKMFRKSVWTSGCFTPAAKIFYLTSLFIVQPSAADGTDGSLQRIAESLELNSETKLFVNGLKASALWKYIEEVDSVTIFVPKDEALLNEGSAFLLDVVLLKDENIQRLNELMALHVIPGQINIEENKGELAIYSNYNNGCISVEHLQESSIRVGPEAVVTGLAEFKNGRIYYIDRLLWEPYEDANLCIE